MKVFVLDDDPTGTQTVHDVPVLTLWEADALAAEFDDPAPAVFVLTNSRALPADRAAARAETVGRNLHAAAACRGNPPFAVISRSDSTLRGHFPVEVDALAAGLGAEAPVLLCPYFAAGGRVTIGDVHYVQEGGRLIPVGETEFARDATFGYRSSDLKEWVAEKTGGRIPAKEVASVSLEALRAGAAPTLLRGLRPGQVCVLNCETEEDLALLIAGIRRAEASGARFLFRTAASFAAAYAGIAPRPWHPETGRAGGLIVVGSYVEKTTGQLERLLSRGGATPVAVAVPALLGPGRDAEIGRAAEAASTAIGRGETAAVYTSRERVQAGDLSVGGRISQALVAIVRALPQRPAWLLAKGGVTSSDLATEALTIRRARVLGQIAPGVPAWRTGDESRWPGLVYVVFPGNVGGPETLAEVVARLSGG